MKESREKKRIIEVKIAVHPVQAELYSGLKSGAIDIEMDSLRDMAKKIGRKQSPQIIKHHLDQLVKLGALQRMYGQYAFIN